MKRLLDKLEIDLPIIQAPMAGVSTPEMAAAVSNAGGLGSIGVGAVDAHDARKMILATQQLTNKSINVNVFCHRPAIADSAKESAWISLLSSRFAQFDAKPPERLQEIYKSFLDDDALMEVLLELHPRVVSFHFGLPSKEKITRLKAAGIVLLATATNVSEGRQIAAAGVDAIVAQGYEAGGHRGMFDPSQRDDCLGLAALIRLLLNRVDVPIIAAGGIMDGAGIIAGLNLGAEAAQLGTAFINCPESVADKFYRNALESEAAFHTVMTRTISGRPARGLPNLMTAIEQEVDHLAIPDYPIAYHASKALNFVAKQCGEGGYGAQWAGQGAPLARSLPAAELVLQLKSEISQGIAHLLPSLDSDAKRSLL